MKKVIAVFVLACAFTAASANNSVSNSAGINAKTNAFIQPFSTSYMLDTPYIWFTDADLTNPTGSYCDVFYEMDRLRSMFGGYSFSHIPYGNLTEFEYGIGVPWLYATIYSDMNR